MTNHQYTCDPVTGNCKENPKDKTHKLTQANNIEKITITYYYDALCGWCYGFKDEFQAFVSKHRENIDFKVVSGGLFLNTRVGYINDVAPYVKAGAYKTVEEVTQVKFGIPFLNTLFGDGQLLLNSVPPAIALVIIKQHQPDAAIKFAELLLKAVYHDAIDVETIEAYKPYTDSIGFSFKDFSLKMKDPFYAALAQKDFQHFKEHQIQGMPTLVVEHKNRKGYLSNGFATCQQLEERLNVFLKQSEVN